MKKLTEITETQRIALKGSQGEQGITGLVGPMGPQGPQGPQGQVGRDGHIGTKGIDGAAGSNGTDGAAGSNGSDGTPPEHKWVGNALQFTKADGTWGKLTDLTGPQGSSGSGSKAGGGGSTSPLRVKGDLWGYSTEDIKLPIGNDQEALIADSSTAIGFKWATPTAVDHSTLLGLLDDDHTQYLLADGTRTATKLKVTNSLYRSTATLNGTATNGHVNLGSGVSVTGTPAQAYDFISILGGHNCKAESSYGGIVSGQTNQILGGTGTHSFIGGGLNNTLTNGARSTIAGGDTNSSTAHYAAIGGGKNNIVSASFGVISGGGYNRASSYASVLGGNSNEANGLYSTVCGGYWNVIQTGNYKGAVLTGTQNNITSAGTEGAILNGKGNLVSHRGALAAGGGSSTRGDYDFVMGNVATTTPDVANNTIRLEASTGNIKIDGAVSSPEADYAEMFEWADANTLNEDRVGYFVSLIKDKIVIGNSNVIGIMSGAPAIIGDSGSNHYHEMYMHDEWKRPLFTSYTKHDWIVDDETHTVYVNDDGVKFDEYPMPANVAGTISTKDIPIDAVSDGVKIKTINPYYDHSKEHIPRIERPEWDAVGLLGKLYVRAAEPITTDRVDVDVNGMAVNGTTYHVLKVVSDTQVRVLLK